MKGKGRKSLRLCLVLLIAASAYCNTFGNEFVWDDQILIVENSTIRDSNSLAANLTSDFFSFDRSPHLQEKRGYYRPLVTLSYMLDYAAWGLNPVGYHLTNLILHGLCAVLVYSIVALLFPMGPAIALLAASLFAAHPIHTESVSWISGRTDLLASFFFLFALYTYMQAAPPLASTSTSSPRSRTVVAVASFALGLLAKESAFVLPAVLAAYEFCFRSIRKLSDVRRLMRRLAPYLVVAVFYLVVRFLVLDVAAPVNPYLAHAGIAVRLITFVKALGVYVAKLAFPHPLSAYYSMPLSHSLLESAVLAPLGALVGVVVWLWKSGGRGPVAFATAFLLFTLLPVSNVVPIGAPKDMEFFMAERFLYLPSVSFCLLLAMAFPAVLRSIAPAAETSSPKWIMMIAAPLILTYVFLTLHRNRDWRDEVTFYRDTLAKAPFATLLHYNLGVTYKDQGRMALAEEEIRATLQLDDSISEAHNNLANLLFLKNDAPSAIHEWKAAVSLDPGNYGAWYNLAGALDRAGRPEEALKCYAAFLESVPPELEDLIREVRARFRRPADAG